MGHGELVFELEDEVGVSDVQDDVRDDRGGGSRPGPRLQHGPIESGTLVLQVRHGAVVNSNGSREAVRSAGAGFEVFVGFFWTRAAA